MESSEPIKEFTLETLCDHLDQLSLVELELMDKLIMSKMNLEKSMRNGFYHLSKARYILGNKSVSASQLPGGEDQNIHSLVRTQTATVVLDHYEDLVTYPKIEPVFLNPLVSFEEEEYLCEQKNLNKVKYLSSTRKRGSNIEESIEELSNKNTASDNVNGSSQGVSRDPIKWFTALPPQTLRQSQTYFKTAIELSAETATIQAELRAACREYIRLSSIKKNFDDLVKEE